MKTLALILIVSSGMMAQTPSKGPQWHADLEEYLAVRAQHAEDFAAWLQQRSHLVEEEEAMKALRQKLDADCAAEGKVLSETGTRFACVDKPKPAEEVKK